MQVRTTGQEAEAPRRSGRQGKYSAQLLKGRKSFRPDELFYLEGCSRREDSRELNEQ